MEDFEVVGFAALQSSAVDRGSVLHDEDEVVGFNVAPQPSAAGGSGALPAVPPIGLDDDDDDHVGFSAPLALSLIHI